MSMIRFIGLSFVFMLSITSCHAREEPPLVVSQDVSIAVQPESHSLTGTTAVTLFRRSAESLRFRLSPLCRVLTVTEGGQPLPFDSSDGNVIVRLVRLPSARRSTISIAYNAVFDQRMPDRIVSTEDPTYGITAVIGSNGVFLGNDAYWYPVADVPPKEQTLAVAVPTGFEAVASGELIARRVEPEGAVFRWRIPLADERLSLSAGPYTVTERQMDGLTVATYLLQDDPLLAKKYLDASVEYLRFYQGILGPYPFKSFAVVENFFPTGYGFPGYTLLGSSVIRLPFIASTSLPHEIAHCWWGNGVRVDSGQGNWSEGLVTYLADYLLEERKSPEAAASYRWRILADYASLVSPETDFPLKNFTGRSDPASRSIGYGKCAMVFHMVRMQIGDKAFWEALRSVLQEKMFKEASWSDFIRAFSLTSGRDLSPFFAQWVDRPGGPRLSLANVHPKKENGLWRVSGILRQLPPLYEGLTVPLRLENAGLPIDLKVPATGGETPFTLSTEADLQRLLLDPDANVFRLIPRDELPPTINRIKGSREVIVVTTANCQAEAATFRDLLESMGLHNVPVRTEKELSRESLRNHDLLFCGIPHRKELSPRFDRSIEIRGNRFAVGSTSFGSFGDALFAVGLNSVDPKRVAGLFLPLSSKAAEAVALKITHYGKFGYLAFHDGENRLKGSFPLQAGSSMVEFPRASQ